MARLVIIATTGDPDVWQNGEIVDVLADGTDPGAKVVMPRFGIVDVPGVAMKVVRQYTKAWQFEVEHSQVWYPAQQGYRVTMWAKYPSLDNLGSITQAKIQHWLDRWNCVFHSADQNQVVFDMGIYESSISEGFWERPQDILSQISFSKVSFIDDVTRIQADYSGTTIGPTPLERQVENHADDIISHDGENKVIVFEIEKATLLAKFRRNLLDTANRQVKEVRRRYYFDSGFVDSVISNGGILSTDVPTALANIIDRADLV